MTLSILELTFKAVAYGIRKNSITLVDAVFGAVHLVHVTAETDSQLSGITGTAGKTDYHIAFCKSANEVTFEFGSILHFQNSGSMVNTILEFTVVTASVREGDTACTVEFSILE